MNSAAPGSTTGMATDYGSNNDFQRASADAATHQVLGALDKVLTVNADDAFTYADYGTGPGGSGMALYNAILRQLRDRAPSRALTVIHQDLPGNAWETLLSRLENDPDSYLSQPDPPTVMAAVGSFYDRRTPPNSVHLGTSFMAAHWMSRQEVADVPSSAALLDATGDAAIQAASDAAADWLAFWSARRTELAPGGAMVVRCIGALPEHDHSSSLEILRMLGSGVQSLANEGVISQAVADDFVLSEFPRTVEQASRPFIEGQLPGLVLVDASVNAEHDPIREQFDRDGDATAYAKNMTGFLRAFTEPSVRAYLGTATDLDRHQTDSAVENIYTFCETAWEADPNVHPFRAWTLTVTAHREDTRSTA